MKNPVTFFLKLIFFTFFVSCIFLTSVSAQQGLTSSWSVEGNRVNSSMGNNLGSIGDVNGDTYPDFFSNKGPDTLAIYYGSVLGYNTTPGSFITRGSDQAFTTFTYGDLNNDGYDDFIVGDYLDNKFKIYYGASIGLVNTPGFTYLGTSGQLGYSLDANGDINNDGFNDLVVGQPSLSRGSGLFGNALIFYGYAGGIHASPDATLQTIAGYLDFGSETKFAGDVNNDGYDDLLIASMNIQGHPNLSSEFTEVFLGSSNGIQTTSSWSHVGHIYAGGSAGDVNGDNYDDIYLTDITSMNIFTGNSTGLNSPSFFNKSGFYGGEVAAIGDFNNDLYDDIAIADFNYNFNQGKFDIYLGGSNAINSIPGYTFLGNPSGERFDILRKAGDVDKDGFADMVVGLPSYTHPESNEGRVLLFNGQTSLICNFSVDKNVECLNGNVFKFTDASLNGAISWSWDFGDGNNSTLQNPSHSYTSAGNYTVSLTVKNSRGHNKTKTVSNLIVVQSPAFGGTYTVGGSGADFNTIQDVNNFIKCGISGDVVFKINNGFYNEILQINNVANASGNYSMTFKSNSGNADSVMVAYVNLRNTNNVYFENLSFYTPNYQGTLPDVTLKVVKGNNVNIHYCKIYRPYFTSTPYLVYIDSSSSINVTNNFFASKPDTISGSGDTYCLTINNSLNVNASKNFLLTFYGYGISGAGNSNLTIESNIIKGKNNNGETYYGINLTNNTGIRLSGNRVYRVSDGIIISNNQGKPGFKIISNNSIGRSVSNGLQISQCRNLNILQNTIKAYPGYALQVLDSDTIDIKNNIFQPANKNRGSVLIDLQSSTKITSDYNCFFGFINTYQNSGSTSTKLSGWRDIYGQDVNSLEDSISFLGGDYLKPSSSIINEAGFYLPEVPFDIDSVSRGLQTVDLGAYQISGDTLAFALNKNIGIVKIVNDTLRSGNNIIKVKFSNFTRIVSDSVFVSYQVDGGNIITELWKGTLHQNDTVLYAFSVPYLINKGRIYNLKCWITLPAPQKDFQKYNDTIVNQVPSPMKGVYTVYGVSPDFININQANANLSYCGVDSMIIFSIRAGDYTSEIFNCISAPYNIKKSEVVYRGETGDPKDVTINLGSIYGPRNLTIKNISIQAGSNSGYSYIGIMVNGGYNIIFDSCIVNSSAYSNNGIGFVNTCGNVIVSNTRFKNLDNAIYMSSNGLCNPTWLVNQIININKCQFDSTNTCIRFNGSAGLYLHDTVIVQNNLMNSPKAGIVINGYSPMRRFNFSKNIMNDCKENGIINDRYAGDLTDGSIYNNKMNMMPGSWGVLVYLDNAINLNLYNNMFSGGATEAEYGIDTIYHSDVVALTNCKNCNVFYNSFLGGLGFGGNYGSNNKIINNSFYSDSTLLVNAFIISDGEYNSFYRNRNKALAYSGTNIYFNIKDIPYPNATSISADPMYVSRVDLHTLSPYIQNLATPISWITHDIDGDLRDPLHPDIGADETQIIPQAPPMANAGSDQLICGGKIPVTLNGSISGSATGAIWSSTGSGTFVPDNNTLTATYLPTDADVASDSIILKLTTIGATSISTDRAVMTFSSCTGINNKILSADFRLYPNPINSNFTIEVVPNKNVSEITITNSLGEEIKNINIAEGLNSGKYNVDLTGFPVGIYFVIIKDNVGSRVVKSIIKV